MQLVLPLNDLVDKFERRHLRRILLSCVLRTDN